MTHNDLSEVYNILTKVCDKMIETMFQPNGMDVGRIGLLIHKKRGAYGYCYIQENWKANDTGFREIGLTPTVLMAGEAQILTTLAHELVHAYNAVHKLNDCNGRRHNKRFKAGCDKCGLGCQDSSSSLGYTTSPEYNDDACKAKFDTILSILDDGERYLINHLETVLEVEKSTPKAKDRNLSVFICPQCGVKARAKPSASLICGDCEVHMVAKD